MRQSHHRLHVAEPKAAYPSRPPLVVDASVMAAALFGEANQAEAIALLHSRSLHAPHLLDYEIASVGLKKLRSEAVPGDVVLEALGAYGRLQVQRHAVDADNVAAVAKRHGVTAYDAAYLCVAAQIAAPLATLDDALGAAARAHLAAEP